MEQRDNQCGENINKSIIAQLCAVIADSTVRTTLLSRFIEF